MTTATQPQSYQNNNPQHHLHDTQDSEPGFLRFMRSLFHQANEVAEEYELAGKLVWRKQTFNHGPGNNFTFFELEYVEEADTEDDKYKSSTFQVSTTFFFNRDNDKQSMLRLYNATDHKEVFLPPDPEMIIAYMSF